MIIKSKVIVERFKPEGAVSRESTESMDDAELTGDDGTCNDGRMCLLTIGLLLNDRRKSGCAGSKEKHDMLVR